MPVRYAITAPDGAPRTVRLLGAQFTEGRATVADPAPGVLLYFRRHGYAVEPDQDDGGTAPPGIDPDADQDAPQAKRPAGRSRSRSKPKEG